MIKRRLIIGLNSVIGKKRMMNAVGIIILLAVILIISTRSSFGNSNLLQGKLKLTGRSYAYPIGLDGSPYLFEQWKLANITLESEKIAEGEKVKINIISDDLLFYNEELKRVFVVDKGTVKGFTVNPGLSDSMVFIKFLGKNVSLKLQTNDFIQVLQQGTISLYVKHKADVIDANDVSSKDKVYQRKYYFVEGGKGIVQIKPKLAAVVKLFPGKKKEIKKLMKENRISRSTEFNLIKLVGLLNEDPLLSDAFKL